MAKGINPNLKLKSRSLRTVDQYLAGLEQEDRFILSEVLTLIESNKPASRLMGEQVLNALNTKQSQSLRIGITGSPGAGKSTFIEALGQHFIEEDHKVAVLAVDPSSTKSQGSILGDKTRMQSLSTHPKAFVRPTASANKLGGVAQATKESIALCEAAGYDIILIESVGVGQSETELADLVDMYLLLLLPGGGDGVQGIKRGIVELADMMIVNKFDGNRKMLARQSKKDFAQSIALFHHDLQGWKVPVELCSSIDDDGFDTILEQIKRFSQISKENGFFYSKRRQQDQKWLDQQIQRILIHKAQMLFDPKVDKLDPEEGSVFKLLQDVQVQIEQDFIHFQESKNNSVEDDD